MYSRRSPISALALLLGTVSSFFLITVDPSRKYLFGSLIFITGFLVSGTVSIVAGVVCADIGKESEMMNNKKAVATVSGIVVGVGSIGAAVGQFVIGLISQYLGWQYVFISMTLTVFFGMVTILGKSFRELKEIKIIYEGRKKTHGLESSITV
mmetsp:Transcript_40775/g.39364  ORF Transcript_40775/g.39364 Transcript_40775/m.39364 type:complete len:153 (-) Transcript_40775:44-502(-)